MAQDPETLFSRAQAAVLRARQLSETITVSLKRAKQQLSAMQLNHFTPADRKIRYPQDFPETRPVYQPFPAQADDSIVDGSPLVDGPTF